MNAGVLTEDQAGHSLTPDYVRWQTSRNRAQLGRDRLDLTLLHNPERTHPGDRPALHCAIRDAFEVLEGEPAAGHVAAYPCSAVSGSRRGRTPYVRARRAAPPGIDLCREPGLRACAMRERTVQHAAS
ncbi:hypothetical protein OG819_47090 [Streptomyces sp. NBC_01549]|uniref:hypothetical protein n=1 Tax=unclassified Streptomyces TaxID=2593676 RepID=UPI00224F479A|nr:hypothetical protein [Streptomyces sp. NBC_01549]MCX4596934.1 hypothetical protein [Streptomyces sp. NBC_01549]